MISISLAVAKGLMLLLVVFGLAVDLFCVCVCVIFLLKGVAPLHAVGFSFKLISLPLAFYTTLVTPSSRCYEKIYKIHLPDGLQTMPYGCGIFSIYVMSYIVTRDQILVVQGSCFYHL